MNGKLWQYTKVVKIQRKYANLKFAENPTHLNDTSPYWHICTEQLRRQSFGGGGAGEAIVCNQWLAPPPPKKKKKKKKEKKKKKSFVCSVFRRHWHRIPPNPNRLWSFSKFTCLEHFLQHNILYSHLEKEKSYLSLAVLQKEISHHNSQHAHINIENSIDSKAKRIAKYTCTHKFTTLYLMV